MSGAQSPLSGKADCERNMGDVLGKEGREDELSEQMDENMEREEAEGAETEQETAPQDSKALPGLNSDSRAVEQVHLAQHQPTTVKECANEDLETKDCEMTDAVTGERVVNSSQETCGGMEGAVSSNDGEILSVPIIPCINPSMKSKDKRSNSDDVGVFVEESDIDIEGVGDADDEDGYEDDDDDDYEDYDDEEGGVDADDEDDFAENENAASLSVADSCGPDELHAKRSGEIKVSSDCVYSYSDSSDDSGLRTKNKSGGRICDSLRRRKTNKVKECALPRSNIPSQVDQASLLSEAMTNLKLDNGRLDNCDGNENQILQRVAGENMYNIQMQERLTSPDDILLTKSESNPPVYQGQEIVSGAMRSDGILSTEEDDTSLNEEEIKQLMRQEALRREREPCTCESCETKRVTLIEQRKLQGAWMELRHFVREVYRIIMQTAPDDMIPLVDTDQDEHMKAIAKRLTESDPHQLYHRLQAQVHEVATAVKVRLKDISEDQHQDSLVATDFFEGLFYCYDKVSAAAKRVAPILEDLEAKHLSRFNLTWELLNKAVYYQVVYNDVVISMKLPEMIGLVSEKGQEFQGIIQFYMAFDDEMSIIQAMWRESFQLLQKYNSQQAKIRAKQQMLLRDWELFKAQRKRLQRSYDEGIEIDRHSSAAGNGSEMEEGAEVVVCPSCNRVQPCPCDECCLSHLFACRTHQAARRTDYCPPHDGPRVAGDGAGDAPHDGARVEPTQDSDVQTCQCNVCSSMVASAEDRNGLGVLRSTYGPSYFVPSELHPPPLETVPHDKMCPYGCHCNGGEGVHDSSNQSLPYQFSSQQTSSRDSGMYPNGCDVNAVPIHSLETKPTAVAHGHPQSALPNHCHNNGCLITEKDKSNSCSKQGENQDSVNKVSANDHHLNGVIRCTPTSGTVVCGTKNMTLPSPHMDNQTQKLKSQAPPQPRARFTAGPGVNVPDTDVFPDPPPDFAIPPSEFGGEMVFNPMPPSEFAGEIKTGAHTKSNDGMKSDSAKHSSKVSLTPISPSTKIGSIAGNGQEPIFVLTKAGAAPPPNIPTLQGKPGITKEKQISSSVPSTPPATPPSNKAAASGPTIQGLLEEALERKKAEMARATVTAVPREAPRTVAAPPSTPLTGTPAATTAAQPKQKSGHTCSSAKHKQHTHSPSHRDPKNCDCCFCEMFGHGAPPAAPTSHRFHENRQRLRSKLNKSRASKQQAAGVRPAATGATAAPVKTAIPPAVPKQVTPSAGATAAPAQRTQAVIAARPPGPIGPATTSVVSGVAGPRPTTVGAAGTSAVMKMASTAFASSSPSTLATRQTVVHQVHSPGLTAAPRTAVPTTTSSGAAAARAIAQSVTNNMAMLNQLPPAQTGTTVRPTQAAPTKLVKTQPIQATQAVQAAGSTKPTVTSSNQRIATPSTHTAKASQPPTKAPQTLPAAQTVAPQRKAVAPAPAPTVATPKEEPPKKEDSRPIDELLDFIEGGSNCQPKTSDSKKAAKKARQKQKKLEQLREEEMAQTPDVTISMLKDADCQGKGKKGASKRTEEVVSTIPSATAQSIRDRIKSQVGEVAKKMGTSDQPQMVTIRRVMEPNSSEPTVTITLKGATPDKDKVLFTLVNGQNEVVCHDQVTTAPKSKKQRKLERRLLRQQQQQQIQVEEGVDDDDEEEYEQEEEEEVDMSTLTKTQRKKLRRLQRKQEEERLAEEQRRQEELERLRIEEEERRRKEEEARLQQQKSKKNTKKEKQQKSQPQQQSQITVKKGPKTSNKSQPAPEQSKPTTIKTSKVNSAPDSDEEFIVPVQMTKKERKKARKVQQLLEEEERRQRQKEEEEREKLRQQELKEQKKKQKELEKLKKQQSKQQEKQQQKGKDSEKKQKQPQPKTHTLQQQQQQPKQKQKQVQPKQQQQAPSKRGGRITTSIIPNPLTLGSYMPPVGSMEWTSQALAASRPSVTIQPAAMSSATSSLGGLEQRFSTTLTLNGKPIMPPPRQPSPEPAQDFSLENLKLPPGITITKVDPSQVSQRKPPVSKPQVTKTIVSNPPPTTIIAAPLSGNRQNNYSSGSNQDSNSSVIVVDTGKLKQDIAKREDEPEQVVTRKKKNNKNKKSSEAAPKVQPSAQLPPYLYGMNSVSITPAGQPPPYMAAPAPPPQAAIIKMNGNMVTIRNPAIHPTPQRYVGPDDSATRKSVSTNSTSLQQNRKENSNLPPRFATAKLAQQANGMNGYVPEFGPANHRSQHYNAPHGAHSSQAYEVPRQHRLHYEPPPRLFESRPFEPGQPSHYDGHPHQFDAAARQSSRHIDASSRSYEHVPRHFEPSTHHFEHPGHLYNNPSQQVSSLGVHEKPTKHVVPQNYAAAMEGKKSKLKNAYNDDWQLLDNVFAPKDIDLDDGEIDADERELEAFKRFCQQSVPPKRKEKVHLNIEDIVLKKKSSPVSCT